MDQAKVEEIRGKLKQIHYSWYGLGALWLAAFIAVSASVRSTPEAYWDPSIGHMNYSHGASEPIATVLCIAYLIGGFILGKIHNRHTKNFVNATYDIERSGDMTVFKVTAAKRHMPFWVLGLFGFFLMFSLAYMFAGNGVGVFFTLLLGGVLYLISLQPKLWRPIGEQSFEISSSTLKTSGETFTDIKGYFIGNFLPTKAERGIDQAQYYQQNQTYYMYGTPGQVMAAQGMQAATQIGLGASQAGGAAIAEVANRYFYEMRARSYQIEGVRGGKNVIVCKGIDAGTAQAVLAEIEAIRGKSDAMAA